MITSVRLSNWRAYGDVTVQLETGTTFLVAMNGVGKSSLIEAVKWALDRTAKPTPDPIRKGTRLAAVELTLDVDGETLRVKRTLDLGKGAAPRRTPKDTYTTSIGDTPCTEDDFFARLEAAWGADSGFVARTAFLTDDLISGHAAPELRAHLCKAFGLDHLERTIQELGPAITAASKEADAARENEQATEAELAAAERNLQTASAELAQAEAMADYLRHTAEDAARALTTAETAQEERRRLDQWHVEREQLGRLAMELVGQIPKDTSLLAVLRAASTAAARQLEQAKEDRTRLAERLRASQDALERLLSAAGECPVCRRPLDDSSRGAARTQHEHDQQDVSAALTEVDVSTSATIAEQLQALVLRAERLGEAPPVTIADATDIAVVHQAASVAKTQFEAALTAAGESRVRRALANEALDALQRSAGAASQVPHLYRKHGVLEATRVALEGTIEEVLRGQLGPIGLELNRRWNAIFSDRPGLDVGADGRITRKIDDEVLDFASFSSGEKTVAQLLFRLATLVTTTSVPFCWIDEPLEHLDPESRTIIARTLTFLTKQGYLRQIIVTTYEVDLANKLGQSDRDHVHLEYLGTSQVRS